MLSGFSDSDLPFAAGSVVGVRNWYVKKMLIPGEPCLYNLRGAWLGNWQPGINQARCLAISAVMGPPQLGNPHVTPHRLCGCGYWAYWEPTYHDLDNPDNGCYPVTGIIRGHGRTLIGERGFRCEKAEILGFTVAKWFTRQHVAINHLAERYRMPFFPTLTALLDNFPPSGNPS